MLASRMEGLKTIEDIDEELNKNIDSLDRVLHTKCEFWAPMTTPFPLQ